MVLFTLYYVYQYFIPTNQMMKKGGSILLDEEVTTRDQISEQKYRLEQADRILLEVSKDVNARSVVMNAVRSKYYEDESL